MRAPALAKLPMLLASWDRQVICHSFCCSRRTTTIVQLRSGGLTSSTALRLHLFSFPSVLDFVPFPFSYCPIWNKTQTLTSSNGRLYTSCQKYHIRTMIVMRASVRLCKVRNVYVVAVQSLWPGSQYDAT